MTDLRTKINQGIASAINAELGTDIKVNMLTQPAKAGNPRFNLSGNEAHVVRAAEYLVSKGLMTIEKTDDYSDPNDPEFRVWYLAAI